MNYQRIKGDDEAARILATRLREELQSGKKVLWLLSGGSNVPVVVKALEQIRDQDLRRLTMMLCDERYGPVGHDESNLYKLKQAGFIEGKATLIATLSNSSLQDTARYFSEALEKAFASHDVVIGQFGIGDDGHIAGILPHSPATVLDEKWAISYDTPPLTRITMTPHAITKVTAAYCFVFGENKRDMLLKLRDQNLPIDEMPSRVLKMVKEAYVYNDQVD